MPTINGRAIEFSISYASRTGQSVSSLVEQCFERLEARSDPPGLIRRPCTERLRQDIILRTRSVRIPCQKLVRALARQVEQNLADIRDVSNEMRAGNEKIISEQLTQREGPERPCPSERRVWPGAKRGRRAEFPGAWNPRGEARVTITGTFRA